MWGIMGGSGFEKFDQVQYLNKLDRETPFGLTSTGFSEIRVNEIRCFYIPRHGIEHELLPSEVNYRANIFALKKKGVTQLVSISAVGSLKEELAPGDLIVVNQYLDRTKGIRPSSFCGDGVVGHVSLADPVWELGCKAVKTLEKELDFRIHFQGTYVCIEGPYFSTRAESRYYRQIGADVIGMTHFPEVALAREAGIAYLPLCFVTDYDSWNEHEEAVQLDMILEIMKKNNRKAMNVLMKLLPLDLLPGLEIESARLKNHVFHLPGNLENTNPEFIKVLL